jgi:hypothetical protein
MYGKITTIIITIKNTHVNKKISAEQPVTIDLEALLVIIVREWQHC